MTTPFLRAIARPISAADAPADTSVDPAAVEIVAPAIGLFRETPAPGSFLGPGAVAGSLQVLNSRHTLVVPEGVSGQVAAVIHHDRATPVQYGDVLFRLVPSGHEVAVEKAAPEAEAAAGHALEMAGKTVVRASTVGTFYRRPGPDSPAYVEMGSPVAHGTTLGLIEVMKVFNQVQYDGEGPGTVAQILVGDAAEVVAGQPLFLIEPALSGA